MQASGGQKQVELVQKKLLSRATDLIDPILWVDPFSHLPITILMIKQINFDNVKLWQYG